MTLIVRSSPLHGAGVYTTAPIKSGERVLEYTGPRLTKKQTEGMYADSEVTYLFGMQDGKTVIDGFGTAAFVNHSCDPNCETDQINGHIWIIAVRDIGAGEELTYDYNLYDVDPGDDAPCFCGTKECRGTMLCPDEVTRHKRIMAQRKRRREQKRLKSAKLRRRAA